MNASDIETLERVIGDISHTGPVIHGLFTFISKYTNKAKMTEMLQAGEHQLHQAGVILNHKDVKKLLGDSHNMLTRNYAKLHDERSQHENDLQAMRTRDIIKKASVSRDISSWVDKSTAYKYNVIRQSDWAKLGLVLRDGKLIPIKDTLVSPSEQTLVAPASRNVNKTVDKEEDGDESDGELCPSLPYFRFDDIPLNEDHETPDPMSDGSGPSVPPKKVRFAKLLKGKARA